MVDLLGHELESKDTLETLEKLAVAEREFKDKLAAVEQEFKKGVGKKNGFGGRFGGVFDPPLPTLPVVIVTHLLSIDPESRAFCRRECTTSRYRRASSSKGPGSAATPARWGRPNGP